MPSLPASALQSTRAEIARLHSELSSVQRIVDDLKAHTASKLQGSTIVRSSLSSQATDADIHEFVRQLDSLVWLRRGNEEARRDEAVFEILNLQYILKRVKAWEEVVRRKNAS